MVTIHNPISPKAVRAWYRVHKWSSLICAIFLLMACITGLPLVFHDEINAILQPHVAPASMPSEAPMANVDQMVSEAQARFPSLHPYDVYWDDDEPRVFVYMSPSDEPKNSDLRTMVFDAHTGKFLESPKLGGTVLTLIFRLHTELFLGLTGEVVMAVMALSFVLSLVSGTLVYGPFMRRLRFGTYRREAAPRTRWFDLHNLLGIVTLTWALVVGATGAMNTISTPLFAMWRSQTMPQILAPYQGKPMPRHFLSVDAAVKEVSVALPWAEQSAVLFPNAVLGSPRHYLVWNKGKTPITSRLLTPVLVDVETGRLTVSKGLPWYLRTLEVSRPLHFGDYGGMPLKIIWALFDLALIVVLLSGVYLWLSRHKAPVEKELDRLVRLEKLEAEQTPAAGVLAR